jgi:hypothetical protein
MRTEYSLVDSERIVDNLGNQGTVLELRKIADALIDQSKRSNANCPCSGWITAYPEVISQTGVLSDWRQFDLNLKKTSCTRARRARWANPNTWHSNRNSSRLDSYLIIN